MINKYMPMYHEEEERKAKPIGEMMNLFGQSVPVSKNGRPLTQRQTLIKYFSDRAQDRKGPLEPARVGFMLSHLKADDLYYMKSVLESETARPWPEDAGPRPTTHVRWNRIFWGMLKPEEARR